MMIWPSDSRTEITLICLEGDCIMIDIRKEAQIDSPIMRQILIGRVQPLRMPLQAFGT
jgi:hypothetical protein